MQVGVMRRGRYVKGKKVGKANIVNAVRPNHISLLTSNWTYSQRSHLLLETSCNLYPGTGSQWGVLLRFAWELK
jgi:hypothetical protein